MTTLRDLFIRFLLFALFYVLVINLYRISFLQGNVLLGILAVVILVTIYLLIIKFLKDKKRVSEFIKPDLANMNYTILSERPLNLKEQYENFDLQVGVFTNIMPYYFRYRNHMKRRFVVRNEKNHDFELIITIIQTWRNKFSFRIESTSRIRN